MIKKIFLFIFIINNYPSHYITVDFAPSKYIILFSKITVKLIIIIVNKLFCYIKR